MGLRSKELIVIGLLLILVGVYTMCLIVSGAELRIRQVIGGPVCLLAGIACLSLGIIRNITGRRESAGKQIPSQPKAQVSPGQPKAEESPGQPTSARMGEEKQRTLAIVGVIAIVVIVVSIMAVLCLSCFGFSTVMLIPRLMGPTS